MQFIVSAVLVALIFEKSLALQCWKCSSDIDQACRDPFNYYNSGGRQGSFDPLQQNNDRNYDSYNRQDNYNRQFDNYNNRYGNRDPNNPNAPNYNQGLNYNGGGYNSLNRAPTLERCDDNEARNRRMKNVCLKEIVRGSNYQSVVRRCEMVPFEQTIGTCSQSVSRGLTLEFCEYCDYDSCNSATGLKTNLYFAALLLAVVYFYH